MKLKHLTDQALLKDVRHLVEQEREILSKVLWHLREIDNRKLYSDLKCGSLFEYCVKILKYSEGQASRRVTACRLLKELPEISRDIESGELNLTQLNQAKHFFFEENITETHIKYEILDKIKGSTTRESERILWSMKKEETPRKRTLLINEETFEALKELQALKAHSCPDLDSLIMRMREEVLKIWEPQVHRQRKASEGKSRYVPVAVKAEVWQRDKARCVNCGSTYALEFDHIAPFSLGGKTTSENLRLLCRSCNQRKGMGVVRTTSHSRIRPWTWPSQQVVNSKRSGEVGEKSS